MKLALAKGFFLGFAAALVALLSLQTVQAHGVNINYSIEPAVTIQAVFDGGEPMAEGQVSVFGPDSLTEPQITGITDEEGFFTFTPDTEQPGTWTVQVRQAGHGQSVDIEFDESGSASSEATALSTPQTVLMGASVLWGLVGTALFFYRGDKPKETQTGQEKE